MRFGAEVRWAWTRGIGAGLAGVILAFATVIAETYELRVQAPLGVLTMLLISGGAMLVLVGGLMRPLQRVVFRHGMPSGRLREAILRRRALRWWYGLDEFGQERDD